MMIELLCMGVVALICILFTVYVYKCVPLPIKWIK